MLINAVWKKTDHGLNGSNGTLKWDSYVGLLRGTLTWDSYLGFVRGILTWYSYLEAEHIINNAHHL